MQKIGSGTFGMVHLVRRRADGLYFALKRVPLDKDAMDESRAINNEVSKLKFSFCLTFNSFFPYSDISSKKLESRQRSALL